MLAESLPMLTLKRFALFAAAATCVAFVSGQSRGLADDEKTSPPAKDEAAGKESAPDLTQILERLNRLERELVELRIKSGKIPGNKKDQQIITLVDTPYLGSVYYGSPTNLRFFAAKLTLINLTEQPLVLKPHHFRLT